MKTEAVIEGRTEERWVLVEEDDTPEWAVDERPPVIGRPATRLTARARVTGTATYTSDVNLSGMLEARVLRSPHANARVTAIDLDAARAVPGVHAVVGPGDVPQNNGGEVLTAAPAYAGKAIAAVAAESVEAAEAALAALDPQYDVLDFVVDLTEGFERQDFLGEPTDDERGDTDAALAAADVTIETSYSAPVQLHNPLETHCAVSDWRPHGLTVWCSTQSIYGVRSDLAATFGLELDQVRVLCEYMGGGFGAKISGGEAGVLSTELSRRTGRPVRLVLPRRDENLVSGYRTAVDMTFLLGASADGTLTAVEGSAVMGLGTGGWTYPVMEPAKAMYRCANVHAMVVPIRQNLGPTAAFRAPGVMEGTWAFEQAIDELAIKLGMDPLEFRRRNHADHEQSPGEKEYTSKRLVACYDMAAELAGWSDRASLEGTGRIRRGMGCASQYWWGGGAPPAYAEVRIGRTARPILSMGLQDLGTGTITASAMVVAERLGIPVESVRVQAGDTSLAAHGPTSGGSMTLSSIAPAVRSAGHHARTQLLELAADLYEISASDLTLEAGEVRSTDGTLRRPITDVTEKLGNAWVTGRGSRGPNPDGLAVNTFGCQIAQVAVDTLTGEVTIERIVAAHDVGRIINPMGARSQALGGIMQGIGFAMTEERVVDPTTGTVVNPGLEDYKIPTMADTPEILCAFVDDPDPSLPLGIKGLGEPPIIPTAAAIGNAIAHAIGVRLHEAPYTPRRVLEALPE